VLAPRDTPNAERRPGARGSHMTHRWREQDSNPRSPPLGKNANMRSRAKIGKSRPAPTAAWRGLVRPVHQLPGRSAILRNLTAG
jgi:hypothetical protein